MAGLAIESLTGGTSNLITFWRKKNLAEIEKKLEKLNERTNTEH